MIFQRLFPSELMFLENRCCIVSLPSRRTLHARAPRSRSSCTVVCGPRLTKVADQSHGSFERVRRAQDGEANAGEEASGVDLDCGGSILEHEVQA
jgi:hypothetical protein